MRLAAGIGPVGRLLDALAAARGALFPWAPVLFSLGIGGFFAATQEPGLPAHGLASLALAGALVLRRYGPERAHVPALALALVAAGFLMAGFRAHMVAGPVLADRYHGTVQGRIVDIDRSFSDQIRVTLDRVALKVVAPARTPLRVRIALHGADGFVPEPGQTIRLTASLSAPEGPVAPGGFDFQRIAWFERLGAVGYSRDPVSVVAAPDGGAAHWAFRARMDLSRAMQARMDGQAGAFAAAMMTGDRSGVTQETNRILRDSNLSHLISISGLHMGLLAGFVFGFVRYGMALVPPLALRLDTRKVAAAVALLAATAYLALAGPDVATRRAYVMAAVMLLAVLSDRRAISLRSVALAAMIVFVLEPESLVEPGFQMSFGATVALILVFQPWRRWSQRVPAPLRPLAVLCLSSLAAGVATGPIAAAHFNRIAEYGFVANLVAVPIMGVSVMPAGVVAAILAPVGMEAPALWVMQQGTALVLWIAALVASLEGAVIPVVAPGPWVLPLLSLGALLAFAGRGAILRVAGVAGVVLGLLSWTTVERPLLLMAPQGTIVGLMTDAGRAMSKPKGGGFVAQNWLEDDGDPADQVAAFERRGFSGKRGEMRATLGATEIVHATGKTAPARAAGLCRAGVVLVMDGYWRGGAPACALFDARRLESTGAVAGFLQADGGIVLVTARELAGRRLWNDRDLRAARLGN